MVNNDQDQVKTSSFVFGLVVGALALVFVCAVLALAGYLSFGEGSSGNLGAAGVPNRFPHGYIDDGYGYYVNGVPIIDQSGNVTAKNATFINGVSTSTVAVGSSVIGAQPGKSCLWNGTQYTILSFAAGSVTPVYATSTVCQ